MWCRNLRAAVHFSLVLFVFFYFYFYFLSRSSPVINPAKPELQNPWFDLQVQSSCASFNSHPSPMAMVNFLDS